MARYSYKCPEHGEFTVNRKMTDKPLEKCTTEGCTCKIIQVFSSPMVKWSCGGACGKIN